MCEHFFSNDNQAHLYFLLGIFFFGFVSDVAFDLIEIKFVSYCITHWFHAWIQMLCTKSFTNSWNDILIADSYLQKKKKTLANNTDQLKNPKFRLRTCFPFWVCLNNSQKHKKYKKIYAHNNPIFCNWIFRLWINLFENQLSRRHLYTKFHNLRDTIPKSKIKSRFNSLMTKENKRLHKILPPLILIHSYHFNQCLLQLPSLFLLNFFFFSGISKFSLNFSDRRLTMLIVGLLSTTNRKTPGATDVIFVSRVPT